MSQELGRESRARDINPAVEDLGTDCPGSGLRKEPQRVLMCEA